MPDLKSIILNFSPDYLTDILGSGSDYTKLFSYYFSLIPPDLVTFAAIVFLAVFFMRGLFGELGRVSRVTNALGKENKRLKAIAQFSIQEIGIIKENIPQLSSLLEEFSELMNIEGQNSQNAESIFSDHAVLQTVDVDATKIEHYPGLFTSIGIAGTFIGLLTALVGLSGQSLDSTELVGGLLDGAGIAFLTSIFGVTASIVFLVISRVKLGSFESALHTFRMTINNKLERVTSEQLLSQLVSSMDELADDISTGVGEALAGQLKQVNEVLATSLQSAGSATQDIVSGVMGGIQGSLESFNQSVELQMQLVKEFERGVEGASKVSRDINEMLPNLAKIGDDLLNSSKRFDGLPDALISMQEGVSVFTDNWAEERDRITKSSEAMREQFTNFEKGIQTGLQTSMEKFDEELSRAGQYIATWIANMNKNVESFENQISTFSSISKDSYAEMQESVISFNNEAQSVASKLEESGQTIVSSISTIADNIRSQLNEVPKEYESISDNIQKLYEETSKEIPVKVESSLDSLVKAIDSLAANTKKKTGFFSK